jgi:hypothetical protein
VLANTIFLHEQSTSLQYDEVIMKAKTSNQLTLAPVESNLMLDQDRGYRVLPRYVTNSIRVQGHPNQQYKQTMPALKIQNHAIVKHWSVIRGDLPWMPQAKLLSPYKPQHSPSA